MIGGQATGQPHHLDIAPGFAFQAAAGGDPVQVSIDEQLEKDRGVISGPPCPGRRRAHETKAGQVEFLDEKIDDADHVILADPVLEAVGKKHRLATLYALDETRHAGPPALTES